MRRRPDLRDDGRILPAVLLAILVAACGRATHAEPPAAVGVREAAPEIYYLQDDAGRLVPVPGFRYRDFVDLLRIKEGLPGLPEPPPAVLERVVLRGAMPRRPEDAAAEAGPPAGICEVTVELTVRQSRSGWVSLPIDLDGLLLTAQPRYEGPGRMMLAADAPATPPADGPPQSSGYRLWTAATTADPSQVLRHAIVLTGNVAVDATADQETLRLAMPRATASLVELTTPRNDAAVTVRPAAGVPRVEPLPDGTGSTVTLLGLVGAATVRIGAARGGEGEAAMTAEAGRAVPQAMVESMVRIDGRVAVTAAAIRVDNLPGATSSVRIALPPRATLRSIRSPAALVSLDGTDALPVAVVRVPRSADARGLVELECERPIDPTGREPFEPLGFAVEGIPQWRQWGRVSLVVDGDWQVEWDDLGQQRRIDPPASARGPGFVAAFAYDAQPARLPLRVLPRGSRLVIEPEYRYDVSTARVSLEGRLRVSVRGAPVSRIVVSVDGWNVDEVGPAGIVDSAAVSSEGGRLVIPLLQPLSGDTVVEIRAGRPLEPDAGRVGWRIPVPQADLVGPASVIITSQSDIELMPDAEAIRGLVRQLTPTTMRSDADRVALVYRLDGTDGLFEAARRFLPRRVDASIVTQVDIDEADSIVRETIRYDVAHVPLEFIMLSVPEAVLRTGTLEVRQNGLLLNPGEAQDRADAAGDAEPDERGPAAPAEAIAGPVPRRRLRALLAAPLLGAGEVTVAYELPTPGIAPESTVAEDLPLVMPAGTRVGRQSITLTVPDSLSIEVRGDAWKRDVASPGSIASRTWTTARPHDGVPLAISLRKRSPQGDVVVDAAWMQTRLIGPRREDIFRYCVLSSAEQLTLSLPRGLAAASADDGATTADGIEVRLNGQPQSGVVRADGRITVELPARTGSVAWLLELVVSHAPAAIGAAPAAMPRAVPMEPPVFPPGTLERRFYWEVFLDPDEHVLLHPSTWTSQQRWQWASFGLERVPVVSQDALTAWLLGSVSPPRDATLGTGTGDERPPPMRPLDLAGPGSRTVFSGVGPPDPGRLWVIPTWLLVLAVSGPVLAVGLAGVYLPRLRTVPVLLGLAAACGLGAAVLPELAPLTAQAALPGAALAAVAAMLRLLLRRSSGQTALPAPEAPISASSLIQVAPQPSLIIAGSAADDGATGIERARP